jgi:hypothetical protein
VCGRVRTGETNSRATEPFSVKIGRPGGGCVRLRAFQHGVIEIGVVQVSAAEIGSPKVSALQVRASQIGKVQAGIDETGLLKMAPAEISRFQVTAIEPCSLQPGARQVGVAELCIDQTTSVKLQTTKVHSGQVELRSVREFLSSVRGRKSSCQDANGGLDIWREDLQPGSFLDGRGWVFGAIRCPDRRIFGTAAVLLDAVGMAAEADTARTAIVDHTTVSSRRHR